MRSGGGGEGAGKEGEGKGLHVLTNQYITLHTSQYTPNSERSVRVDITHILKVGTETRKDRSMKCESKKENGLLFEIYTRLVGSQGVPSRIKMSRDFRYHDDSSPCVQT